jgi:hypothetical protein
MEHGRSRNWPETPFGALWQGTPAGTEVALHLHKFAIEGDAMSICGVITTKDVLRHSGTIVREFGAVAYIRCCVAILMRRRTTFLNCVCELTQ